MRLASKSVAGYLTTGSGGLQLLNLEVWFNYSTNSYILFPSRIIHFVCYIIIIIIIIFQEIVETIDPTDKSPKNGFSEDVDNKSRTLTRYIYIYALVTCTLCMSKCTRSYDDCCYETGKIRSSSVLESTRKDIDIYTNACI